MNSTPERTTLICVSPRGLDDPAVEQFCRNASAAGIGWIVLVEPHMEGLPHREEMAKDHVRVVRWRLQRIGELGVCLKMALTWVCGQEMEEVVTWTIARAPSPQVLGQVLESLRGSPSSAVCATPTGWKRRCPGFAFASGLAAYRVAALRRIPFRYNTDDDHFTFEVFLQLQAVGCPVDKVAIGSEPLGCHHAKRSLLAHGWRCLGARSRYRANRMALIYHPKFDFLRDEDRYIFKEERTSLHQHVLRHPVSQGTAVIELGAGQGHISRAFHQRGASVLAVDLFRPKASFPFPFLEHDLEGGFAGAILEKHGPADLVIMLDVIEHLADPERAMADVWRILKPGGTLLLSTGNVAYLPLRVMLLAGLFNYGRRGILDLTHRRLFTYRSMRRLLVERDFRAIRWLGFGPPIADLIGHNPILLLLDRLGAWLARLRPSLFAYQLFVEAERLEGIDEMLGAPAAAAGKTTPALRTKAT